MVLSMKDLKMVPPKPKAFYGIRSKDKPDEYVPLVVDNTITEKTLAVAIGKFNGLFYIVDPAEAFCDNVVEFAELVGEMLEGETLGNYSHLHYFCEYAKENNIPYSDDSYAYVTGRNYLPREI